MKGNRFNFWGLMTVITLISSISLATAAETQPAKIAVVDARVAIFSSDAAQSALKTFRESIVFITLKAKYENSFAKYQFLAKTAETKRLTWSPEKLAEHQKQMSNAKDNVEIAFQKITTEQKELEQKVLKALAPLVEQAINEIVNEEGISILLRAESVLTASPEASITAKLADRIDAKSKPE
ncbi:MAG: OmpH family outer membrane protein [Porticoccaceae bacterium]|nr:OmpH family outer membrane protein [Porticoccaceae bacterium]